MLNLVLWQLILVGLLAAVAAVLLAIWWRQQSDRWILVVVFCLLLAPVGSWWSGIAFQVPDYRAGCDGLCPGYRGAPIPFIRGEAAGESFLLPWFLVNLLVYAVILLGWSAIIRAVLHGLSIDSDSHPGRNFVIGMAMIVAPLAFSPWVLPPPEARVRGDSQRVSINAWREVYMYDQLASLPVMRVALEDVRPRPGNQSGMRVCFRMFSAFYMPIGHMYLDMTAEGVHSNNGGVLPLDESCWETTSGEN